MDAYKAIVTKRDTREYTDRKIPEEVLHRILMAGRMAVVGPGVGLGFSIAASSAADSGGEGQRVDEGPMVFPIAPLHLEVALAGRGADGVDR